MFDEKSGYNNIDKKPGLNQEPANSQISWRARISEWCRIVGIALILTLLLTTYVVHAYRVEGRSMEPNFQNNDLLLVNKFIYRVGSIHRGDIVVLLFPYDPEKTFLKRVVGLPGDVVQIKNGVLYINGKKQKEDYLNTDMTTTLKPTFHPGIFKRKNYPPIRVKPYHYFVLGDNRDSSYDSRDFDLVPEKYIIGKVFLRYWPLNHISLF